MTLNCLIIDDEQLARSLLKEFISKIPYLNLIGECKNPLDAFAFLEKQNIDLIFLDIQMPDLNGIEFLKSLNEKPAVILTTAYSEYALDGFDLDVTDYLVKPFSFDRFLKATNKAKEWNVVKSKNGNKEVEGKNHISIYADHKVYKIKHDDILYIEGLKEYVSFFTSDNKRIITLESLKRLEELLPSDKFIRIHKSYIVPIDKIKSMEGNEVEIGSKKIPIGRSYKEEVVKKIF